jgi:hypothetical protein
MKRPTTLLALLALLTLAGCETAADLGQSVRGRLAEREAPRVKVAAAEPRPTYEAVRAAATQMGYRFLRGGPAQGEFEAVSGIGLGETPGSSRQIGMKVKVQATLDGKGTRISVRLTEIIEADSSRRAGLATETPLRDTPQYEVFFQRVAKQLGVPVEPENTR